jgi:hypothetical protein
MGVALQFENQVACACGEVGKDKLQAEPEQSGEMLELGVVGWNEGVERPAVEALERVPVIRDLTPYSAGPGDVDGAMGERSFGVRLF